MQYLFEDEQDSVEWKANLVKTIVAGMCPADQRLWEAYVMNDFSVVKLVDYMGQLKKSGEQVKVGSNYVYKEIKRIKKCIKDEMKKHDI